MRKHSVKTWHSAYSLSNISQSEGIMIHCVAEQHILVTPDPQDSKSNISVSFPACCCGSCCLLLQLTKKHFTQRKGTCSLQIQQVAQKHHWLRRSFVFCLHFRMGLMEYVVVAFSVKTDLLHFQWKSLHFPKQTCLTTDDVKELQLGGEY